MFFVIFFMYKNAPCLIHDNDFEGNLFSRYLQVINAVDEYTKDPNTTDICELFHYLTILGTI